MTFYLSALQIKHFQRVFLFVAHQSNKQMDAVRYYKKLSIYSKRTQSFSDNIPTNSKLTFLIKKINDKILKIILDTRHYAALSVLKDIPFNLL